MTKMLMVGVYCDSSAIATFGDHVDASYSRGHRRADGQAEVALICNGVSVAVVGDDNDRPVARGELVLVDGAR